MNKFDTAIQNSQNKFIRHAPHMLKGIFGVTDVTPLWVADMEFPVAEPIATELKRLADRAVFAYEFDSESVYQSIVDWNKRRHNLALNARAFVGVPGVLTGIALLLRQLTQPGDGILIQTPVYHQFARVISTANRKIVKNPLHYSGGQYEMDFEDLEGKLASGNVKVILLCNPHNPIGRVWQCEELQRVVELANTYNVTIISDEIHSDIIYSGHQFNSLMAIAPEKHISVLGSPAKTFGMQSISNGYIYTVNEAILESIKQVVDSMYLGHGNAFTTFATIAAYRKGDAWLDEFLNYLEATIAWVERFLQTELPMVRLSPVEGTYQIWLDFSKTGLSEDALKEWVFQKSKLGLTPGSWFDQDSGLFMRMNIAAPLSQIQTALRQLAKALRE